MRAVLIILLVPISLGVFGCSKNNDEEMKLLLFAKSHQDAYFMAATPEAKIAALNDQLVDWTEFENRGYFRKSPNALYVDLLFIRLRLAVAVSETGRTGDAIKQLALASHLQKLARISGVLGGLNLDDPACLPKLAEKVRQLDDLVRAEPKVDQPEDWGKAIDINELEAAAHAKGATTH
jgi:hypothetical protein